MAEENLPIIPLPGAELTDSRSNGGRIVGEMVLGTLALSRAVQEPRFRIGAHEFCEPDYRQILLWAADSQVTPDQFVQKLHWMEYQNWDDGCVSNSANLVGGKIKQLCLAVETLNIIPNKWMPGLELRSLDIYDDRGNRDGDAYNPEAAICLTDFSSPSPCLESLSFLGCRLRRLRLNGMPNLKELALCYTDLDSLDLAHVSRLTCLLVHFSPLAKLDLTPVPLLVTLSCMFCELDEIDLSMTPLLTNLDVCGNQFEALDIRTLRLLEHLSCAHNHLTHLDLSAIPKLRLLWVDDNQLRHLDLSDVPLLTELRATKNHLSELDIRPLGNLKTLSYDKGKTRLIQRPDQNF